MRKKTNIIEINNRRYDTVTGAMLDAEPSAVSAQSVSGVSKKASADTAKHPTRTSHRVTRRPVQTRRPHQPAASRTLMRQTVKKPDTHRRSIKAYGHTDVLAKRAVPAVTVKPSIQRIDGQRLQHAKRVAKSRLISHFSLTAVPISARPANHRPHPTQSHPASRHHAPASKVKPAISQVVSPIDELLEQALQQADSYQELPPRKNHRFRSRLAVGSAVRHRLAKHRAHRTRQVAA